MRTLNLFLLFFFLFALNSYSLPKCEGDDSTKWHKCNGTLTWSEGDKYVGEYKDGKGHGQGTYTWASGSKYVGEWKDGKRQGQGTYTFGKGPNEGDRYVG
jgi:hypothetical protein